MAVAGALTYKLINYQTVGFVGRTRNLALSFVIAGNIFLPELFNPFLHRASNIA
jgi:hypothetical protein